MSVVIPSLRPAIAVPGWAKNELWRKAQAVPSLDLRFADSKSLIDATTGQNLVTFSRASGGTYVDSQGVIRTAGTNVPRFDHNPSTGESLGLLVEEARTNLLWPSQFTTFATTAANNIWYETIAELDTTANAGIAPDGTTTAALLSTNTSTSFRAVINRTGSIATSALAYSVFCKAISTDSLVRLLIAGETGVTNSIRADFTLSGNGSVSAVTTTGTAVSTSTPTIQNVGNGWYRCTIYPTFISPSNITCLIYPGTTSAQTTASQTLVWGAQLEAGAFPTSYIPTTTATVTRAADLASITGTNFSSWYRQDEGTVFVDAASTRGVLAGLSDGTATERFRMAAASSALAAFGTSGGTTQFNIATTANSWVSPGPGKGSMALKTNDIALVANGSSAATDASAVVPNVTKLIIGNGQVDNYLNGHLSRLTYWPRRLPNATLQSITQ